MATTMHGRFVFYARAVAPLTLLLLSIAILLRFPPTQSSFYPQCPIHHYLGILCPGCGTTRALAALLHGHLEEAFRLNALTMLLIPVAAVYAGANYPCFLMHRRSRWMQPPSSAIYATLAAAVIFAIGRNL